MIADAGTSRRWTGRARALPSATFGTTSTAAPRTARHLGGPGSCDGEHASKGSAQHGAVTKHRPKVCNADRCSPAVTAVITAYRGAHSPNALHAVRGGTWDGTDLRMGMPSALMITYPMNPGYEPSFFMVSSTSDCRGRATSDAAGARREHKGAGRIGACTRGWDAPLVPPSFSLLLVCSPGQGAHRQTVLSLHNS